VWHPSSGDAGEEIRDRNASVSRPRPIMTNFMRRGAHRFQNGRNPPSINMCPIARHSADLCRLGWIRALHTEQCGSRSGNPSRRATCSVVPDPSGRSSNEGPLKTHRRSSCFMGVFVHQKTWIQTQGTLQSKAPTAKDLIDRHIGRCAGEQPAIAVDRRAPAAQSAWRAAGINQISFVEQPRTSAKPTCLPGTSSKPPSVARTWFRSTKWTTASSLSSSRRSSSTK